MTTFVLVHGAWHGGWCYKRVARSLRQAGHEVYTPTLTGLGERAHLMGRTIDLTTHIQDIVSVIRCEELSDVVLCGHSYGGMVIAGVVEQIGAKVRSLVYLDAFVPENGKSVFDYLPAEQSGQMRTDAAQNGEGYKVTPIPAAVFAVNDKDAAWVDAMCVKHPLATFEQKLALSGRQVPKRVYIIAAGWEPSPFQQFGARYKNDRDWQFVSMACGHDVMVDQPRELADALIAAGGTPTDPA
jgi:pimeloyl-ACP methyl ester carboxylesterase